MRIGKISALRPKSTLRPKERMTCMYSFCLIFSIFYALVRTHFILFRSTVEFSSHPQCYQPEPCGSINPFPSYGMPDLNPLGGGGMLFDPLMQRRRPNNGPGYGFLIFCILC